MATFAALAPLIALAAGAFLVLLTEAFIKRANREALGYVAVLVFIAAAVLTGRAWGLGLSYFGGKLVLDSLAILLTSAFLMLGAFVVLMAGKTSAPKGMNLGEFCGLVLIAVAGLMVMVSSTDWLVVFLGLEVLSVASYALAGLKRTDRASSEAAAKYFLMGSFAGAFFVFGLALVFGATGRLDFAALLQGGTGGVRGLTPAGIAGLGLILAAFGFKIAVAPFHMWAPDVYEGAPTPVTVFLTVGPKAAGLTVLLRLMAPLLRDAGLAAIFRPAFAVLAVLTMFAGNLAALRQTSVKRLLAYSSIAHTGYLLVALAAGDGPSLVFYLVAYLFMNAGAFVVLAAVAGTGPERVSLDDLAGLGRRYPWLAAGFSIFLLSLAGFPPTAGFLAKFYVFSAAVREGQPGLALAAVLASLVSVAYYLKVIVFMYMKDGDAECVVEADNPALYLVLFLCLFATVQLGLWPGNLLSLIRQALTAAF